MFALQLRLELLLPAVAFLLCACPRRPLDFGKDGEPADVEALLKRVAVAESQVFAVKGEAKLKVSSPQANGTVTLFAAVSHPALLHIEQLDFFGKPQGLLTSDGDRFGFYDASAGTFYRGPASAANVARFIPLAVPPAELAALMLGRAPRIPHLSATMRLDPEAHVFAVTLVNGAISQALTISLPEYRVVKSVVSGATSYDLSFENLEALPTGGTYPRRVVIASEAQKMRAELNYKDVVVNEAPDLTLFEIESPGATVPTVEVGADGAVVK